MTDEVEKVLEGKRGWLFLNNDTNRVISQITGEFDEFNAASVEALRSTIAERAACVPAPYVFAVAPNKECVYSEMLPDGISLSEDRPIRQLMGAVDDIVYPLERMVGSDLRPDLYQKTDTHWNAQGAFLFAEAVLRRAAEMGVPVDVPSLFDVSWSDKGATPGDLGSKLSPQQTSSAYESRFDGLSFFLDYDNGINNRGLARVYTSDKPLPTTAIMFCDSFGFFYLARILARYIGKVICVRQASVDIDMVNRVQPDLVITEMVERFLVHRPPAFERLEDVIAGKIAEGLVSPAELAKMKAAGPDRFGIMPESTYRHLTALAA